MAISLQTFASGDTDYIAKHNANSTAVQEAVNALQTSVSSLAASGISPQSLFPALFGPGIAIVGSTSYKAEGSGSILTVQEGYVYNPSEQAVFSKLVDTNIDFTGFAADTYYLHVDATGEPTTDNSSALALYSIVWTGSAFGAITRLATVAWGHLEFQEALTSTAMGEVTYDSLDARLEAVESAAGGVLEKTVASSDITLTTEESANSTIYLSGAQTADIDLIVPDTSKSYNVLNDTTGGYTVTLKTSGGTGVELANGEGASVMSDGTDVQATAQTNPSAASEPYDLGGTYNGAPTASAVLLRYPMPRSVTFPSGLTGSQGVAGTAATAQTDFDIKKGVTSVGTMRFAASATTATFIMASESTYGSGDILTVVSPATPDATLADIGFALKGTR